LPCAIYNDKAAKDTNFQQYFNMFHLPCNNQIQKYTNNQHIHFNIYDVFYSQSSHQHVSAGIPGIFRVMLLLQEYKCTNLVICVTVTIKIIILVQIMSVL